MKTLFTLLVLISFPFQLIAQSKCDCKPELDFVYEQMKSNSSFKDQIKGKKRLEVEEKYQNLGAQMEEDISTLDCFWVLNDLMAVVQDKHSTLTEVGPNYKAESILDSVFIQEYRSTEAFQNFPKTDRNIEELKQSLQGKATEDIEGIYAIGNKIKMGVYRTSSPDSLVGVILSSEMGIWEPGQIYSYIKESNIPSHYDITYYSSVRKNLLFSKAQFFDYGMLLPGVVKENVQKNYAWIDKEEEEGYTLSYLSDDVQYVWLNSFFRKTMPAKRDALIAQISTDLSAKNLIIDLRNNAGGADKISLPILKALKKKSVNIYIITNFFTGSNAEMTTVRLKKQFDATQLGQRTYGAISYGSNYGRSYDSPSGLFNFYPTDMRQKQFIAYEEVGVRPDVTLAPESDWIEQTLKYIESQSEGKK
ncbi:S41 family peptidase [Algoriphagus marinus]|uniref:S41 family peptidase n=1 Tax=Algoriphagus marinus TaxID=1925762 RepID=UPI000AB9633D|nr:S41 family peptidase [Algoriphagus marinus]